MKAAGRPRRILVIDNDAGFVDAIGAYLRECGHAVETASSGLEALAALGRGRPDLVLLNVQLPGIKGLSVLAHLSQADSTLPIFVTTSGSGGPAAGEALRYGALGCVPKPVKLQYLDHLVDFAAQAQRADGNARQ